MRFVGLRQLWHSRRPNHHKGQKTQKQMVVMKNAQDTRQTEDKKYDKSRWQHWKNANHLIDDHHPAKKKKKTPVRGKKQERKKRFTEEGRLSSLLSTKEFLLYLFASSWGQQFRACNRIKQYKNNSHGDMFRACKRIKKYNKQQFRACNRIKQYMKQQFPRKHVWKWIETHSVVTQKKTD